MTTCALPPFCACCQGKRFVYLPEWRYVHPRATDVPADPSAGFATEMASGRIRMLAATTREAPGIWSGPTQQNLPVSLRICASCGAAQPYVDPAGLAALVDGAGPQAVYVDHDAPGAAPYR